MSYACIAESFCKCRAKVHFRITHTHCHLIVEVRLSFKGLISKIRFPSLVGRHLYIKSVVSYRNSYLYTISDIVLSLWHSLDLMSDLFSVMNKGIVAIVLLRNAQGFTSRLISWFNLYVFLMYNERTLTSVRAIYRSCAIIHPARTRS